MKCIALITFFAGPVCYRKGEIYEVRTDFGKSHIALGMLKEVKGEITEVTKVVEIKTDEVKELKIEGPKTKELKTKKTNTK